jgi:hypothetical protein
LRLEAFVDSNNNFLESNENNNTLRDINEPALLPDFIVTNISVVGTSSADRTGVFVAVSINNTGYDAIASPGAVMPLYVQVINLNTKEVKTKINLSILKNKIITVMMDTPLICQPSSLRVPFETAENNFKELKKITKKKFTEYLRARVISNAY